MVKIFNRRFAAALLSVAMAAILLAGFGTPAWAAGEDVTATVTIQFYGEDAESWSVTNPPPKYGYPALPPNGYFNSTVVMTADRPSVLDASLTAFEEMGIIGDTFVSEWDVYAHENNTLEWRGKWVDGIFDLVITDSGNSYLPTPSYDGYREGDAWTYTVIDADDNVIVDGSGNMMDPNNVYASNVKLEDGMTIIWNYTTSSFYYPYES
jgi:hypothetical protein